MLSNLKAVAELPCLCGCGPKSNIEPNLLPFDCCWVWGGRGGCAKKKLLKNINETFDFVRSRKKGTFNYMRRETSMLYSYFWTLAHGNCSVCATEISRLFLQNVIFLKINTWNTNEHENHALSGLNLKKNQKKKRCDTADNLTCHNQRLIHTHIAISRKIWRLTWNQKV